MWFQFRAFVVGIGAVVTLALAVLLCSVLSMWTSCSDTLGKVNHSADSLYSQTLLFEASTRKSFTEINTDSVRGLTNTLLFSIMQQTANAWDSFISVRVGTLGAVAAAVRRAGVPVTSAEAINALIDKLHMAFHLSTGFRDVPSVVVMSPKAEEQPGWAADGCLVSTLRVILQTPLLDPYIPNIAGALGGGTIDDMRVFAPGMPLTKFFTAPPVQAAVAAAGGNGSAVPTLWLHNWMTTPTDSDNAAAPYPIECVFDDVKCGLRIAWNASDNYCWGWLAKEEDRVDKGDFDLYFQKSVSLMKEWFGAMLFIRVRGPSPSPGVAGKTLAFLGAYYVAETLGEMLRAAVRNTTVVAFAVMPARDLEIVGNPDPVPFTFGGVVKRYLPRNSSMLVAVSDLTPYKDVYRLSPTTLGTVVPLPPAESTSPAVKAIGTALPLYTDFARFAASGELREFADASGRAYFARAQRVSNLPWVLVVAVPQDDLLGRMWNRSRDAESDRADLLASMTWQRAADLSDATATQRRGIGVAVGVSALLSLLLAAALIVGLHGVTLEFAALGAAMRRTARLESVFDDAALRELKPSRVVEVKRLQVAYRDIARSMFSFARYLPVVVCRSVAASNVPAALGLEPREVTILFCDIADFTTLSERFSRDLASFSECLAAYFEEATDTIGALNGAVDKFIGDAVMALWGAVEPSDRGALDAVSAAIRLQILVRDVGAYWALKLPGAVLHVRSGVNLGHCLVGNIGSSGRFNFTALGDPVNLASRLEGANKAFGTATLVSEAVMLAPGVADTFPHRLLCAIAVKGRASSVRVYDVPDSVLDDPGTESLRAPALVDPYPPDSADETHPRPAPAPAPVRGDPAVAIRVDAVRGEPSGRSIAEEHRSGLSSGVDGASTALRAADVGSAISCSDTRSESHPFGSVWGGSVVSEVIPPTPHKGSAALPQASSSTAAWLRNRRQKELAELQRQYTSNSGAMLLSPMGGIVGGFQRRAAILTKAHLAHFSAAAESYLAHDFSAALAGFVALIELYPRDHPCFVLAEEVRRVAALPPGVWDGAFHLASK